MFMMASEPIPNQPINVYQRWYIPAKYDMLIWIERTQAASELDVLKFLTNSTNKIPSEYNMPL